MDKVAQWLDFLFTRKRWVIHIIFWLCVLFFYVLFFGRSNSNYLQTLFFVSLLMPVTIATTYLINYYMVPEFLMRGEYATFLLYTFYLMMTALFMEMMVALLTFIAVAGLNIRDMNAASFDVVFLLTSLLMVVFLGVAIKMILHWRQSREDYQKLMREKIESELKFLKAQLNPHFLFNTLNNLYYLASQKSDRTPQAILQLSEILDYVLISSKAVFVPMVEELKQVDNYIALELLRYEDRVKVYRHIAGEVSNKKIAPMVLITLIENAFKHGVMPSIHSAWIEMNFEVDKEWISIVVRNSHNGKPSGKGVGLVNLRNQLDLIYKNIYEIEINKSERDYEVKLKLASR